MNIPSRLINLIGAVTVVGVLLAGLVLVALPVYLGSKEVDAMRLSAQQANDLTQLRIDSLAKMQDDLPDLQDKVRNLRSEIPQVNRIDTVSRLASQAATDSGATLLEMQVSDPEEYSAPTGPTTDEGKSSTAADTEQSDTGRTQVEVTFRIGADTNDEIAKFIDGLRGGPRRLQLVSVTSAISEETGFEATVVARAFVLS